MTWFNVCSVAQVKEDLPFSFKIDDHQIGVYLVDGEYHALEDICPHAYALLTQGFIEDGQVECPLHEAVFDIKSGKCLKEPGERDLVKYPVRITEDNKIQIKLIQED